MTNGNQEPREEESGSMPVKDEMTYENDTVGDFESSWNGGQANGDNGNQYNDPGIDQEPAPIGIKEDG